MTDESKREKRLKENLDRIFADITDAVSVHDSQLNFREIGTVTTVTSGIAKVSGLFSVGYEELLIFPGNLLGIAFNIEEKEIGVVLLGEHAHLRSGDEVIRTGRVIDVPVGEGLKGRVINPLGAVLDGKGPLRFSRRLPIERPAAHIMDRSPVSQPLQTGIKVVDALIPVGRGQRELIMGDRQIGKTSLAISAILSQKDQDVICVYCSIGQRGSNVAAVVETLNRHEALSYTVVVVAEGSEEPGLNFIAPYAATSIAEYFMEKGKDVLIVYDDLTHHARAYREISLLLRRPPGREAFPGDIFYIHSRLLERATHLLPEFGGGSLTALPIVETEEQNIAAYIPTNLISITDGQIYLSPTLFELGILPAVDIGKSVSRVGGKAQLPVYHRASGNLKMLYSQFEELESFARYGTHLDQNTHRTIEHGRRIRACLNQMEHEPVPVLEQIAILIALQNGLFDDIPLSHMAAAEVAVRAVIGQLDSHKVQKLLHAERLTDKDAALITGLAKLALASVREGL